MGQACLPPWFVSIWQNDFFQSAEAVAALKAASVGDTA